MSSNLPAILRGKPAIAAIVTIAIAIAAQHLGVNANDFEGEVYASINAIEPILGYLEPVILPILAALGLGSFAGIKKKVDKAKKEIPPKYVHEEEVAKARDELPVGAEWSDMKRPKDEPADTNIPSKPIPQTTGKIEFSKPEWGDEEAWFTTNLSSTGNKHDPVKRYLPNDVNCVWVRIEGAEAIGIQLYDNSYNLIQADQSHGDDEDGDAQTTRLEMFAKSGKRFPPGVYKIRVRAAVLGKGVGSDGDRDPDQDKLLEFRIL